MYMVFEIQQSINKIINIFGIPDFYSDESAVWYLNPEDCGVEKLLILKNCGVYITLPFNLFTKRQEKNPTIPITKAMVYKKISKLPQDCSFYNNSITLCAGTFKNALQKASYIVSGPENVCLYSLICNLKKYYDKNFKN